MAFSCWLLVSISFWNANIPDTRRKPFIDSKFRENAHLFHFLSRPVDIRPGFLMVRFSGVFTIINRSFCHQELSIA
jgi:hypothetical protein